MGDGAETEPLVERRVDRIGRLQPRREAVAVTAVEHVVEELPREPATTERRVGGQEGQVPRGSVRRPGDGTAPGGCQIAAPPSSPSTSTPNTLA